MDYFRSESRDPDLQPATTFEDQVEREGDHRHENQGEGVADKPVQLGHVAEVHPVDRPYERGREQDGGPGGDLLYLLVLGEAGEGQVHAEYALKQLAEAGEPLRDLQEVVLDVAQVAPYLGVDVRRLVLDHVPEHASQGLGRPLEFDHLTRELVDPARHVEIAPEDLGLYLGDVDAEPLDHGHVVVHDPVHNGVQDGLGPPAQQLGIGLQAPAHGAYIGRFAVTNGHDEVIAHENVDLPELDPLFLVDVTGRLEHDEECPAVALQLGPLMGLRSVLDREIVQPELFGDGGELFLRRPVKPDPGHPPPLPDGFVGLLQGARLGRATAVHVDGVVHDHGRIIRPCRSLLNATRRACTVTPRGGRRQRVSRG